ncbi:MAG TPA: transcriptional regulator, partial [Lacisediminihabitans sp.]|uniref:diacylglycerol/lipid kinase family protein n=1 Tax=Lacisediminihabitans sp. TaxID=2787631 RepID=UPI002ED91F94
SGVPLALVPSGTGNLLARNLHLTLNDLAQSIAVAFTGADRSIDIAVAELHREDGSADEHAYLVMAGIGLDANMAANTNGTLKKRIGWLAYADPIAKSVRGNKQLPMRFGLDGAPSTEMRAHTVIVGNCGTLTANLLLLPDAVIDDGKLDVVVLTPKGAGGWMRIGSRLLAGGILHRTKGGRLIMRNTPGIRALQYVQAGEVELEFETPEQVELDGDSFGTILNATIRVEHGGLTVRVPAV